MKSSIQKGTHMTSSPKASPPPSVRVIGIDCSTDQRKVGLAWGDYSTAGPERGAVTLVAAQRGPAAANDDEWDDVVAKIAQCAREREAVLLAMDAPLGWPDSMGSALVGHTAGKPLSTTADCMFQRETDRKERLGKKPLEVGANLIARTAHSALRHLGQIRESFGSAVPLAWDPERVEGAQVIEVYPAATLLAHGLSDKGYKGSKAKHRKKREGLTARLEKNDRLGGITGDVRVQMEETDHALDAVVCCLAAADFLRGDAISPTRDQMPLAKKEGWIWITSRNQRSPQGTGTRP